MQKRYITAAALALTAAATSSCSPHPHHAAPTTPPASCRAQPGTVSVPLSINTSGAGGTELVPVCVDGLGPFQFVLDTGAPSSLVDASLVARLHLSNASNTSGSPEVGCVSTADQVAFKNWSLGAVPLSPQNVLTARVAGFGTGSAPAGVIGGDILSRFGAIRIDFRAQQLMILAPEAAPAPIASILHGTASAAPPPLLVRTTPKAAVVTVVRTNRTALVTTQIQVGQHGPYPFVVATGSARSSIDPTLAKSLKLGATRVSPVSPGVGCPATAATEVRTRSWSAASVLLPGQPLLDAAPGGGAPGVMGRVGSDVLATFGSVVLDYRTAVLWLGAG